MLNFKEENKALVESLVTLGILKTPRIIKAFMEVPRHLFVLENYLPYAYSDIPLPTLGNQTISQPYTVATMLEALSPELGDNVLDIGSGSGWTTCLLAKIVGKKGKVIKDGKEIARRIFDEMFDADKIYEEYAEHIEKVANEYKQIC